MDKKTKFRRVVRANRMLKDSGCDNIFLAFKYEAAILNRLKKLRKTFKPEKILKKKGNRDD